MKTLRKIHLFLGCIFAPMLIFFTLTGALQTFNLHEKQKNGYTPLKIVEDFAQIHRHQRIPVEGQKVPPSVPFRIFVAVMSAGLLVTIILGIIMAFRSTRNPLIIWGYLGLGVLIPIFLLFIK